MNNPNKAMGFRLPKFPKNKIKKIGIRSVILQKKERITKSCVSIYKNNKNSKMIWPIIKFQIKRKTKRKRKGQIIVAVALRLRLNLHLHKIWLLLLRCQRKNKSNKERKNSKKSQNKVLIKLMYILKQSLSLNYRKTI